MTQEEPLLQGSWHKTYPVFYRVNKSLISPSEFPLGYQVPSTPSSPPFLQIVYISLYASVCSRVKLCICLLGKQARSRMSRRRIQIGILELEI